jgi:hypothetical protein
MATRDRRRGDSEPRDNAVARTRWQPCMPRLDLARPDGGDTRQKAEATYAAPTALISHPAAAASGLLSLIAECSHEAAPTG